VKIKDHIFSFPCYNLITIKNLTGGKNVIKIESTKESIESKDGLILAGKIAKKSGCCAHAELAVLDRS